MILGIIQGGVRVLAGQKWYLWQLPPVVDIQQQWQQWLCFTAVITVVGLVAVAVSYCGNCALQWWLCFSLVTVLLHWWLYLALVTVLFGDSLLPCWLYCAMVTVFQWWLCFGDYSDDCTVQWWLICYGDCTLHWWLFLALVTVLCGDSPLLHWLHCAMVLTVLWWLLYSNDCTVQWWLICHGDCTLQRWLYFGNFGERM